MQVAFALGLTNSEPLAAIGVRYSCRLVHGRCSMVLFATEFPINAIRDRSAFVAQVVAWLRGTTYSTVLESPRDPDLEGDTAHLRSHTGEELRLRAFERDGLEAIGFRHDFPDSVGRLWRTEAVVRRGASIDGQDIIRLRTECVARRPGVRLDRPRKPYLIKSLLRDEWGGRDGQLTVSDRPLWSPENNDALKVARDITKGRAADFLPVIYVSALDNLKWLLSEEQIEKLSFDLGGVAHVFVEPSRSFSFKLKDETSGANAYGGALAISLPSKGVVRRFYLGLRYPDVDSILSAVRESATAFRSQMPAEGWDWTELQEQALRQQRIRDRNRLTFEEEKGLYQEEIDNLQDRIRQLEVQISSNTEVSDGGSEEILTKILERELGSEIYLGEFFDRIKLSAKECVARAEQIGLDQRSRVILTAIGDLPTSPGLIELLDEITRATKDAKKLSKELVALLSRHGYHKKSDNKHIRMESLQNMKGLDSITIPKTPSDKRGIVNLRKQIERTLGIGKLAE